MSEQIQNVQQPNPFEANPYPGEGAQQVASMPDPQQAPNQMQFAPGQQPAAPWQQAQPSYANLPAVNMAPFGVHPVTGEAYSEKSKTTLVLLSFFLGGLGIDRFYKGDIGLGFLKMFTIGGLGFWALADFIMFIAGTPRDKMGHPMR